MNRLAWQTIAATGNWCNWCLQAPKSTANCYEHGPYQSSHVPTLQDVDFLSTLRLKVTSG